MNKGNKRYHIILLEVGAHISEDVRHKNTANWDKNIRSK